MKIKLLLIAFFFLANLINAQTNGSISGSISTTESNTEQITVALIKETSDEIIKVTFTKNDGTFEFENIKPTKLRISISHIGFENYISGVISYDGMVLVIPTIPLTKKTANIEEISIVSKKQFISQKADKIVVNPNALISNAGLTAFEVLEKSPSVSIDFNNAISIRGKNGVLVLINDKPTYLSSDELTTYLKSIPASDIDFLEIMSNPPAKYDASGNAGIINIKLKKNIAKGFNGGVNVSYGQGRFMRTNNSANFNYRIQKWNFFTNASVGQNNSYQDLTIKRTYFTPTNEVSSVFTQNSYITPKNKTNSLKIGTDFYATKKTTLGMVWSGFYNPSERLTNNTATILDQNGQLINRIESQNPMDIDFKNGSFNVNMSHKLNDTGEEIQVNLDQIDYSSDITQSLTNKTLGPNGNVMQTTLLESNLPSQINIKAAKVDYSGITISKGKFDLGIKTSVVKTQNIADFSDNINGTRTPNYQFSNDFTYRENINAFYTNYAREIGKFSLQAGLRIENTNIKGYQAGNPVVKDSTFNIKYTNFFPTLYVQYSLDSLQNHVIGLSLGRRIERPNYKDLNPFTYPIDSYTFYGGNPYIQPTFSYNADVSHTYKKYLTTTLMYSLTKNLISETNEQRGTIYYSRPGNFAKQIEYGISVNSTINIKKWWTLQVYSSFLNNVFESNVYTETLNDSKWYWVFMPTNQFQISKKWSAEFSGQYQSKVLSGQFLISPVGSVRLGLATKIFKDKGALKLNISDAFYTNQIEGQIQNIANAKASWFSTFDSRVATISFSYRFSKGETLKVRQSGSSESEQKRVKT